MVFYPVLVTIVSAALLMLNSCNEGAGHTTTQAAADSLLYKNSADTSQQNTITQEHVEAPAKTMVFEAWPIAQSDSLKKLLKTFDDTQLKVIEYLNRADKNHLSRIDTIVVPRSFDSLQHYSPYPLKLAILQDIPKIVYFAYAIQAFAVYENGQLVKWGPTNMGKKSTPTPNGLYFANWKGKEIRSSVNHRWILKWNFNISNYGGIGWHQYELPGYPASHSCIRLLAEDAKWLYDWADQWILKNGALVAKGTPAIVFGTYPWGERKPWRALIENPNANDISIATLELETTPFLEKIINAQTERAAIEKPSNPSKADSSTTNILIQ